MTGPVTSSRALLANERELRRLTGDERCTVIAEERPRERDFLRAMSHMLARPSAAAQTVTV